MLRQINPRVFYPPLLLLLLTVGYSFFDYDGFTTTIKGINAWVLNHFGWLFSWSSFLFLLLLIVVYFSPLAGRRIGGPEAVPLLSRGRWFAISICTTIATGILFWGCAEPLFHYGAPPTGLGIEAASAESERFALSTMYLHWSFTPYAIYCVTGLTFALCFYNLRQPFRVGSLLFPLFGKRNLLRDDVLDTLCLYALILGMSASLGSGILAMMGGAERLFGFETSNGLIALIGGLVIGCFIVSSVTGLQRGIKWLSTINITAFIGIAAYVFFLGNPLAILTDSAGALVDYVVNFVPRSTNIGAGIEESWLESWSIFYWANWFAWAPISSLFLGKLARGYTVRQYIHFNLILPSVFAIVWMSVFSGTTLQFNELLDQAFYDLMQTDGEQSVMYAMLAEFPYGTALSMFTLFIIFLSYVTAADSNISAMSSISARGFDAPESEAPAAVKIVWGLIIGGLTYVMLSSQGIDGIRILSVLGGFPALFIILLAAMALVKLLIARRDVG